MSEFRSLGPRAMEDKLGMQKGNLKQENSPINKKSTRGKSGEKRTYVSVDKQKQVFRKLNDQNSH